MRTIPFLLVVALTAALFSPSEAEAGGRRRPRRSKPSVPSVLRGSEEALARENRMADESGLPRFQDRAELEKAIADGTLVPLADTPAYAIDGELGEEDPDNAELYANSQPWVGVFLDDVLGEGYRKFGHKFAITSLVRTQDYQDTLRETNKAAADSRTKESRSTHLTGATVDISLVGLPWRPRQWLRKRLIALEQQGLIQATEERHQYCMHVLVLKKYKEKYHPDPAPEAGGSVR